MSAKKEIVETEIMEETAENIIENIAKESTFSIQDVLKELEAEKEKNMRYEKYIINQKERYDNLFNLFANNVDYIIDNVSKKS